MLKLKSEIETLTNTVRRLTDQLNLKDSEISFLRRELEHYSGKYLRRQLSHLGPDMYDHDHDESLRSHFALCSFFFVVVVVVVVVVVICELVSASTSAPCACACVRMCSHVLCLATVVCIAMTRCSHRSAPKSMAGTLISSTLLRSRKVRCAAACWPYERHILSLRRVRLALFFARRLAILILVLVAIFSLAYRCCRTTTVLHGLGVVPPLQPH